jgi:hypothetical protein
MDRDFRKNIDGAVVTNIRVRLITLTKLGGPAASLHLEVKNERNKI